MKKKKLLCIAIATAMMVSMSACGNKKDENIDIKPETIVTTGSETTSPVENTEEAISDNNEQKEMAWWYVNGVDFSDDEYVTIPEGTFVFNNELTTPITSDKLFVYSTGKKDNEKTLQDAYDDSEGYGKRAMDFSNTHVHHGDLDAPEIDIDKDSFESYSYDNPRPFSEAWDNNYWSLMMDYLYADKLELDVTPYEGKYTNLDDEAAIIDALIARYGKPNYFGVFAYGSNNELLKTEDVINDRYRDFVGHEDILVAFSYLGWITADYTIMIQYDETMNGDVNGHRLEVSSITYFPTSNVALMDNYMNMSAKEYVIQLAGQNGVRDIEHYHTNPDYNGSASSETEDTTAEEITSEESVSSETGVGVSNFVDVEIDFAEDANENVFLVEDAFQLSTTNEAVLSGYAVKGSFKVNDTVYIQAKDGKVVEATVTKVEQLRKTIDEATPEIGDCAIYVDTLDRKDVDHSIYVIKK